MNSLRKSFVNNLSIKLTITIIMTPGKLYLKNITVAEAAQHLHSIDLNNPVTIRFFGHIISGSAFKVLNYLHKQNKSNVVENFRIESENFHLFCPIKTIEKRCKNDETLQDILTHYQRASLVAKERLVKDFEFVYEQNEVDKWKIKKLDECKKNQNF